MPWRGKRRRACVRAADPWQPHIKAQTPRDQRGLGQPHFPCLHGFFTCRCTLKKNVAGGEGELLLYVGLDGLIPGDREDELVGSDIHVMLVLRRSPRQVVVTN